jgi:Flp pilus assembly protein TadG
MGQGLVEFTVLVPAFMLLLFGMLEFGFVFSHNLTIEYASREGARTGAALANGNGDAAICASADGQIIAAVERVLKSSGSPVVLSGITSIKLYKATSAGAPTSAAETSTWTYQAAGGPTVDGIALDFVESQSSTWTPCTRNNGANPDSIGVSLDYTYQLTTPLAGVVAFFGGTAGAGTLAMSDRTVMSLNP